MIVSILWIVGIYASCIAFIHVWYAMFGKREQDSNQVVLVTYNHQTHVEWCIRYLSFLAWLQGKGLYVTVLDEGSSDDTEAIVQQLSHYRGAHIRFKSCQTGADAVISTRVRPEVKIYRLNRQEDLRQLGLVGPVR